MLAEYPTTYTDTFGSEETVIINDGKTLRMTVRGVEYVSTELGGFNTFERVKAVEKGATSLAEREFLSAATLTAVMSIPVSGPESTVPTTLTAVIDLEGIKDMGDWPYDDVRLILDYDGHKYSSTGGDGSFEEEMWQIQRSLPNDTFLKCCFNCTFAGYNIYGNGLWGMYCHRNHKDEYLHVRAKCDIDRLTQTAAGMVQEIDLCLEFQHGITGYR